MTEQILRHTKARRGSFPRSRFGDAVEVMAQEYKTPVALISHSVYQGHKVDKLKANVTVSFDGLYFAAYLEFDNVRAFERVPAYELAAMIHNNMRQCPPVKQLPYGKVE